MAEAEEPLDELCKAAQSDDVDTIKRIAKQGLVAANSDKAQKAVMLAAGASRLRALQALFDWGAPVQSADKESGLTVLHSSCLANAAASIALLVELKADLKKKDASGRTAMDCAIAGPGGKSPQLDAVKELLRAGCEVSHEACRSVPGLAQVAREAQLDRQTKRLKDLAEERDVAQDIIDFSDDAVSNLQNAHMKLLRTREEQRSGRQINDFELQLAEARKAHDRNEHEEQQLLTETEEKRKALQEAQTKLMELIRMHDDAKSERSLARDETQKINADVQERKSELESALAEKAERERSLGEKEEARREAVAAVKELEDGLAQTKKSNDATRAELKAARGELRGWQRDQQMAASLTAQANERLAGLMAGVPTSPTAAT